MSQLSRHLRRVVEDSTMQYCSLKMISIVVPFTWSLLSDRASEQKIQTWELPKPTHSNIKHHSVATRAWFEKHSDVKEGSPRENSLFSHTCPYFIHLKVNDRMSGVPVGVVFNYEIPSFFIPFHTYAGMGKYMKIWPDGRLTHQRASEETRGQTKFQDKLSQGIPFVAKVEAAIVYCYSVISQIFIITSTWRTHPSRCKYVPAFPLAPLPLEEIFWESLP